MSDAFLAYLSKAEGEFRSALEAIGHARKVYNTFLALTKPLRGQSLRGAADAPSEPTPPAAQAVNADLPSGREAGITNGQGGEAGTHSDAAHDGLDIPPFLDRRKAAQA